MKLTYVVIICLVTIALSVALHLAVPMALAIGSLGVAVLAAFGALRSVRHPVSALGRVLHLAQAVVMVLFTATLATSIAVEDKRFEAVLTAALVCVGLLAAAVMYADLLVFKREVKAIQASHEAKMKALLEQSTPDGEQ